MLREIVLDTETTGLDARSGDRLVEVAGVEIINRIPTGREFHRYFNPERAMPAEAEAIHGLSTALLADKPLFRNVVDEFIDFIEDAPLVIHNAQFDIGFLDAELERVKRPLISMNRVVDTLQLARRKHPAGPNTLDALCKRYGIDNSKRIKHGALMDSFLLAEVYVELLGERQATLVLGASGGRQRAAASGAGWRAREAQVRPTPLPPRLTPEGERAHAAFVESLGQNAVWRQYMAPPQDAGDSVPAREATGS